MADYEIYAGKGMAGVKTTYLRHTYTWSDHSITGEKLGWGITASSTPEDPLLLRELEKLALTAVPDYRSRIPVEMLLYSPVCGYVKMTAMPSKAGNAGRKNKVVHLYQLASVPVTPTDYLSPGDFWGPSGKRGELQPLTVDAAPWDREELVRLAGSREEMAKLVELVYRTLAGDLRQLNLVAPDWKAEEFREKARHMMFLIHEMLPEALRKKAGYLSFARDKIRNIPFVFSSKPVGKHVYYIGKRMKETVPAWENGEMSPFYRAFLEGIGDDFLNNSETFGCFLERSNELLEKQAGGRSPMPCLAFLYLSLPERTDRIPSLPLMQDRIPELLYWGASDPAFAEIAEDILDRVHREFPDTCPTDEYIRILAGGCTKRSMDLTAREIRWALNRPGCSEEEAMELREEIKDQWEALYASLSGKTDPETGSAGQKKRSLPHTDLSIDSSKINTGPDAPLPDKPSTGGLHYEGLQAESRHQNNLLMEERQARQEYEDLQIEERQVEEQYEDLQREEGQAKERDVDLPMEEEEGDGSRIAQVRAVDDGIEDSLTFLITGIVQGFMTGCMLYLSHYTMKLGHWKIALGLLGIWIPIMVNYWYILRQKGEWRPLWKIWGLCLTEGLIIEIAAWFFPTQKMRLVFFFVLGIGVLLVQLAGMVRLVRKNRNQTGRRD